MKTRFAILLGLTIPTISFSQKWDLGGNVVTSSSVLGSTNNESITIITNGSNHTIFKKSGELKLKYFDNGAIGLVLSDANGIFNKLNVPGNPNLYFLGDGTFGNANVAAGWFGGTTTTYTNNKIGIGGISSPVEMLEVNGNAIFNGNVSAQQFFAGDVVSSGKQLRISSSLCFKGFDASIPGSRSEVCALGHDFYIQSTPSLNYNTILNHANSGNVGIGVNSPSAKLEILGDFKISNGIHELTITGNRISSNDSVIHIGDSSLVFTHAINQMGNTFTSAFFGPIKGLRIGNSSVTSASTVAQGINSVAVGFNTSTKDKADYSITIGKNLVNSSSNSLAIGFNLPFGSLNPTLFVSPETTAGMGGNVGIGTSSPNGRFEVFSPVTTPSTFATITNVSHPMTKCWVVRDNSTGSAVDNFLVYGNGTMYAREIFVKLGVLGDFVFDHDYRLMSLKDLELYVKSNHHLPNIPSEEEVKQNNLNVGEMQAKQLQKIEELTLYIIDLQNQINELKEELNKKK